MRLSPIGKAALVGSTFFVVTFAIDNALRNHGSGGTPIRLITTATIATGTTGVSGGPPQSFRGNAIKKIGTITLRTDSTLYWSCPSCTFDDFSIFNNFRDAQEIDVNENGTTSGQVVVRAGTYHDVTVDLMEPERWTVRIVPAQPPGAIKPVGQG